MAPEDEIPCKNGQAQTVVYRPLLCVYDLAGDISQRSKFTFFLNMVNERSNSYVDLHYLSFELEVCRCPFSDRIFYASIDLFNYSNNKMI